MRQQIRRVPVEAETLVGRLHTGGFVRAQVDPADAAPLAREVDQVGVGGVDTASEAVAAADRDPVLVDRPGETAREARPAPRAIVLQSAEDAIVAARID